MLIKRRVFREVGDKLDELFSPGNYEDCDLAVRIIKLGYKLLICRDTFIHHIGSATFCDNTDLYMKFNDNKEKFDKKWGFNHDLLVEVREDFIGLIREDKAAKINILEVGCGAGMNLLILKYKYPNCNIYGIEDDDEIASITKINVNLSNNKVSEFPLEFEKEFFDYIILNDKLHYVDNPSQFIDSIGEYLKIGGHIITNIKNILHISVLTDLFKGNFYTKQRINNIDYKNLFTMVDISNMFGYSGYTLVNGTGYGIEIPNEEQMVLENLKKVLPENLAIHFNSTHFFLDYKKNK